jgi:hypothetical protein
VPYSCFVNSSKCFLAKLTGCAPGKFIFFLSSNAETSWRILYSKSPSALMPGASMDVKGPLMGVEGAAAAAGGMARLKNYGNR